jgi:hypothetical protein
MVNDMPTRRLQLGRLLRRRHLDATPLQGYLCELCQDAPAVQWQPAPEGGEMGGWEVRRGGTRRGVPGGGPMAKLTISDVAWIAALEGLQQRTYPEQT